jgi:hypothetical protein
MIKYKKMMSEKSIFLSLKIVLGILVFACFLQTSQLLKEHFTHIDDIGIAESLLIRNLDYRDNCTKIEDINLPITVAKIFIKDSEKICKLHASFSRLSLVSSLWTYAPFQFYITQYLLKRNVSYSYDKIKLLGRLPSFGFYIVGILCFFGLTLSIFHREKFGAIIPWILTPLAALSLEQRIYAAQMESYSIGLLSNCVAIWCLYRVQSIQDRSYLKLGGISALLAVAISMQYQAILLVASGLMAVGLIHLSHTFKPKFFFKFTFLVSGTIFFSYLLVGNVLGLSNRAVNWNAGVNREFLVSGSGVIERLLNFFRILSDNFFYNLYSIISGFELPSVQANYFGFIFAALFLFGLTQLWIRRKSLPFLFHLAFIYIAVYLLFVFFGKLTFSPTRHFLYYLPFILIVCGVGFQFIFERIPERIKSIQILSSALLLMYCLFSLYSFSSFASKRQDLLSEDFLSSEIAKTNASFLLYDQFDIEPLLMERLKSFPIFKLSIPEAQCNGFSIYSPANNEIEFITYSKRRPEWDLKDNYFSDFLSSLIGNCFMPHTRDNIASMRKVGDLMKVDSITEIDLSNKTKNGSNSYYLQLFSAKLKEGSNPTTASLITGIDFRQQHLPQFVSYTSGITQSEGWGRWTDSNQGPIIIGLREALPSRFVLKIKATAFGPNGEKDTLIKIGDQSQWVRISSGEPKLYEFSFNNVESSSTILIQPASPSSPSTSDPRKLGIGLIGISFQPKIADAN